MITITIDFFDKKTEKNIHAVKLEIPNDLVFEAAKSNNISYINARPFSISEDMKNYILQKNPNLKDKFELCLHEFIGRHGLGPEYD